MLVNYSLKDALDRLDFNGFENIARELIQDGNCHQMHQYASYVFSAIAQGNLFTRENGFVVNVAPMYYPKILETLLNYGPDVSESLGEYNLTQLISRYCEFFRYETTNNNLGRLNYNEAQTLFSFLSRLILQNPKLLGKQLVYEYRFGFQSENPLHSIVNNIRDQLNYGNVLGRSSERAAVIQRKNFKRYTLKLFTLMILVNPLLLEQKCHTLSENRITGSHESTPVELLEHHGHLEYDLHIRELCSNFKEVIKLTKDSDHILSQKVKILIDYITSSSKELDSTKLCSIVSDVQQEIESTGKTLAEQSIADLGRFIVDNLPALLLDQYKEKRIEIFGTTVVDSLKRKLLLRVHSKRLGNVNEFYSSTDIFSKVLEKLNPHDLDKFMIAILGEALSEKLNKRISALLLKDMNCVVSHINGEVYTILDKLEDTVQEFIAFKQFLEDNPAPERRYKERSSEEDQISIEMLFQSDEQQLLNNTEEEYLEDYTQKELWKKYSCVSISSAIGLAAGLAIAYHVEAVIGVCVASAAVGLFLGAIVSCVAVEVKKEKCKDPDMGIATALTNIFTTQWNTSQKVDI